MKTFIIRRVIHAVIVLILVTLIVFLAMRILPGDPIYMIMTEGQMTDISEEDIEAARHEYGLDRPLMVQYFDWLVGVIRGDLGTSLMQRLPVTYMLGHGIPITLNIGLLAFVISLILGIPAGVICAIRRGKWLDTVVTILANIGITVPTFWLGIMLIYLFALKLGWLPVQGYVSPFTDLGQNIKLIVMPVICLAIFPISAVARQTRSSMLEVIRQDYIRTAWSKGLKEQVVITRHALKNGLIPVVTLLGVSLSYIIGGSVLIEIVFNITGVGRLLVNAVFAYDYTLVQGCVLFVAIAILLINFIVDISYAWIDPRIRYE
jgi:peptide/nickel transport system permease protein